MADTCSSRWEDAWPDHLFSTAPAPTNLKTRISGSRSFISPAHHMLSPPFLRKARILRRRGNVGSFRAPLGQPHPRRNLDRDRSVRGSQAVCRNSLDTGPRWQQFLHPSVAKWTSPDGGIASFRKRISAISGTLHLSFSLRHGAAAFASNPHRCSISKFFRRPDCNWFNVCYRIFAKLRLYVYFYKCSAAHADSRSVQAERDAL